MKKIKNGDIERHRIQIIPYPNQKNAEEVVNSIGVDTFYKKEFTEQGLKFTVYETKEFCTKRY